MSSKVVILNSAGELLIVKPSYKDGWSLVGGMVDANESPIQAARREAKEEIGIELAVDRLGFVGVRYGVSRRSGDDYVHFIFKARLTREEGERILLDADELEGMRWVSVVDADPEVKDHAYGLALRVLQSGSVATYSENDTLDFVGRD